MAVEAVNSVLRQEFGDFEVVVSDNSSPASADQLHGAVERIRDPRLVYVRPTAELSMGEHWEFALPHARGEFVGYLTDRMVFRRDALARLRAELSTQPSEVISYSSSGLMEAAAPFRLQRPPFSGRSEEYESEWVARLLALSIEPWGSPNMLNSFASRKVLDEMNAVYPDLMTSIAPDVSFGMHVLDHVARFRFLDMPLMLSYGVASSNGAAITSGKSNDAARDFAARVERGGGLPFAPIPGIITNHNILTNEYCRMRSQQRSGRFIPVDPTRYCGRLRRELTYRDAGGIEWRLLETFMTENNLVDTPPAPIGSLLRRALRSRQTKRLAQPVMQTLSDWLDFNPTNRPVGRFAGIADAIAYDEAHPALPNSRESGFLRRADRIELASAGDRPA